jgi:hypothetical protein
MTQLQGIKTNEIGCRLSKCVAVSHPDVSVFFDHGRSGDLHVCQPTTYMGRRYGTDATLSGVDIVAVKNKKVIVAVEIEEGGIRPKTVLGDVFGIALTDSIRIHRKRYTIKGATVVIAILHDARGKKAQKYQRLERHLTRYFRRHPSESVSKVRIIPCSSTDIVRRIERLVRLELSKSHKESQTKPRLGGTALSR